MKIIKRKLEQYNEISLVAKASIWFIFCSTLQKGISFVTMPIFTRLMTTEQFGQYSAYISWLQILTVITTLRLNGAVFNKGMNKYKDDRDGYTSTMQTLILVITLVFFILYLFFRHEINNITELPTFIMVAIFGELLFIPAIDFWTIRKRYEYIYIPIVKRTVLMAILNALLGIAAVYVMDEKGYARILSCVIINFSFGSALFIYNKRKSEIWFNKEYAKYAILFNVPLLIHYFSQYILEQFDKIMIQKMVGVSSLAIYSVAYSIGLLLRILTQNINNALIPWQYAQLEKKNFKELDDVLFKIYILVAVGAVGLSLFAPEIMMILGGEEYYEGIYVIPPVAMGLLFSFMYTTFANTEFYYNLNKFSMYVSVVAAILNIALNFIGIQLFGYYAAAYTTLISYIILTVGHYIYICISIDHQLGEKKVFQTNRLVIMSFISIIASCAITLLYDMHWLRYSTILIMFVFIIKKRKNLELLKF